MARINDISISKLKGDIINNSIKETFKQTNTYNTLLSSSNPKLATTVKKIESDMDTLDNSLLKFENFLNNYLSDYKNIENYLSGEAISNINSATTANVLYNIKQLNDIKLSDFNIPSPKLIFEYEESFADEEKKISNNNKENNTNNIKSDEVVLKSIEKNFENNKSRTKLFNQELYNRIKQEIDKLTSSEEIKKHATR